MSTSSMRNEGKGEELGGKIRAGVGKLLGNERMQAEGKAHELKGKAKQAIAKAAENAQSRARETLDGQDDEDALEAEEAARREQERNARLAQSRGSAG